MRDHPDSVNSVGVHQDPNTYGTACCYLIEDYIDVSSKNSALYNFSGGPLIFKCYIFQLWFWG